MAVQGNPDGKLIPQFIKLIEQKTGIQVRPRDYNWLLGLLKDHAKAVQLSLPAYYNLLTGNSWQSRQAWKRLIPDITTGESFFFRDQGQFRLLEQKILPEIIADKQKERTLRIWSAGCSTGEEPYSLAILLDMLVKDLHKWNLVIIGTDLNEEAISRAKQGLYRNWSFRATPVPIREKYFRQLDNRWLLDERIRSMVQFQTSNLVEDGLPDFARNLYDMDLILCRNVFIYFDKPTVAHVAQKLTQTLRPGGYLLTGHGELFGLALNGLDYKVYDESVVYRRTQILPSAKWLKGISDSKFNSSISSSSPEVSLRSSKRPLRSQSSKPSSSDRQPFRHKRADWQATPVRAESAGVGGSQKLTETESVVELLKQAEMLANQARYDEAMRLCWQALAVEPLATLPYYLLASIAEEQGDRVGAKDFLNKVIYLAPETAVSAYLNLASLVEIEGDTRRAHTLRNTAQRILQELPSETIIEPYTDITAAQLYQMLFSDSASPEGDVVDA